jgi:hypothetical protein
VFIASQSLLADILGTLRISSKFDVRIPYRSARRQIYIWRTFGYIIVTIYIYIYIYPYQQKLALTSPTSGGRWVGIVRSRIEATV